MKPELATKEFCSGCSACFAACSKNAISMLPDKDGFLYPQINAQECVSCGRCEKVCPVLHRGEPRVPIATYAARTKDTTLRLSSSSGGIFSELSRPILEKGGVVFGCILENGTVKAIHAKAETYDELAAMRGSKYVQSDVRNTFREAKNELENGRIVLFSGTPCQIAGLNAFLGKKYDNLWTVEVICHGAPAPKVFEKFKSEEEARAKISLVSIAFRNKTYSWKQCTLESVFADSSVHQIPLYSHPFMKAFLNDLCLRESCYKCSCREGRSDADFVIADFWGIEKVYPALDDDKGTSLVLIQTLRAQDVWNKVQDNLDLKEVLFDNAIQFNPSYLRNPKIPKRRDWFMSHYSSPKSLSSCANYAIRGNFLIWFVRKVISRLLRILKIFLRILKK